MKLRRSKEGTELGRKATVLGLVLAMCAATVAIPAAGANQNDGQRAFAFSTGLVGIVPGQTARLSLWNKGEKAVLVRLQFVDEEGKVLIQCNGIIQPGKSAAEEFLHPGGVNRIELQAQFGTNEPRSIGLLMPTLQVIDNATGATSWMIGPDGFTEFRPIFNPPLTAPW